jgi:hypothetical protein
LITFHVLFICVCVWASVPDCINHTGSATFKHIDPLIHTSLWQIQLAANCQWISAAFILSDTKKTLLHVACLWCKPLVEQSSLCHARLAQTDNWITLAARHHLTLSYSMTRNLMPSCNILHYIENWQAIKWAKRL